MPPVIRTTSFAALLALACMTAGCIPAIIPQSAYFHPAPAVLPDSMRDATRWPPGFLMEEHRFRATDGASLHVVGFRNPEARQSVLYFGGNAYFTAAQGLAYARAFTAAGANIFLVDYRGYGESEGIPTIGSLKEDAVVVYDALLQTGVVEPEGLVVHGHSLGSFIATYVAEQRHVAGLVLEAPVTDPAEWIARSTRGFLSVFFRPRPDAESARESNLERIRSIDVPLLVLVGERDRSTPPTMAHRIFDAAATPRTRKWLHVFPGAEHRNLKEQEAFLTHYREFLRRLSRGAWR